MKILSVFLAMMMFGMYAYGDDSGGFDSSVLSVKVVSPVTSVVAVASAKPVLINSQYSPMVKMVSYKNVVAPGGSVLVRVHFSDYDGNVKEIVVIEKRTGERTAISLIGTKGILNGYVDIDMGLPDNLDVGNKEEFDIAMKDDDGNVGNYQTIMVVISEDVKYGIVAYSGNFPPNLSGGWNLIRVVSEPNPVIGFGEVSFSQGIIEQSGNDLIISGGGIAYDGVVSGNKEYVTITYKQTRTFIFEGLDVSVDVQSTLSGKMVDVNRIEGESSTIVLRVYGEGASGVPKVYGLKHHMAMIRYSSPASEVREGEKLVLDNGANLLKQFVAGA